MEIVTPPVIDEPGLAARIKADPEQQLAELFANHGAVFTTTGDDGPRITYVLDPHLWHPLLTAKAIDFSPVSRRSKLRFGLGSMVDTDEGVRSLSRAMRGGLRGAELQSTLALFEAELADRMSDYVEGLGDGDDRALQHLVVNTLMPATVGALFGPHVFDADFVDDFFTFATGLADRLSASDPMARRAKDAERALMDRLEGCLTRMHTPMLEAIEERLLAVESVTTEERVRTLLVMMRGSMVNLVPVSVWMLATVGIQPGLLSELLAADGQQAQNLRTSVITETFRLYSRPNMYRAVTEDFVLEVPGRPAVHFFAGDWIALFPRFLHHDPDVFEQPEAFDPQRFCPVDVDAAEMPSFNKDGAELKHPTMVFGAGRGRCPGDAYTMSVLDMMLERCTASLDIVVDTLPDPVTGAAGSAPPPSESIGARLTPRA